ncbi:MAG: YaiI/YqxD family protein [Planctomycetes bacterium]|nr:YaiI/YqxD family protein [Planctomycetota bacterium]
MNLWIDADACHTDIRAITINAAVRRGFKVILVANCPIPVPDNELVAFELVPSGPDVADDYIANNCEAGDLVITNDVPLASRIVEKGASGLDPRGGEFTEDTVQERLAMRNFMEEMRMGGMVEGGPSGHSPADTRQFSSALDRLLTKKARGR